ncbi:Gfo/Idh/MocA family protein [Streptomyces sp. SPB074]|uniref:Gfo/Idh/MocA family protein n=1 Tax=Streptomyces sp. (strain SPB074) TaxID=465543 RepID=UPI0001D1DBB3|nr:Gfo/Idh/MocA family oxidoreductase [Streptomyces sp. SPB074]EFG65367.1 oxidoreductase family, NAD-binding Rossmann fold domain-containing protein [Streptomyces sp. SPB074]
MAEEITGRPVRWGVLATGGIAATFAADLLTVPGAELVAVGSRTPEAARAFAERFTIPRAHGSWAALAADEEVDVVYVATPHSAHVEAARLCLEAGRGVLCEKPMALGARQAAGLVDLARTRDVFLMEAMWTYVNPLVRRLKLLVEEGAIGEVVSVEADFSVDGPFPADHRMVDPAQGGGALLDLGVYPVAFAQLLLGEPDGVRASAKLSARGVDLQTGMLLDWANGAHALLRCGLLGAGPTRATVVGSAGRVEIAGDFFHPAAFVLHRRGAEPVTYTAREEGGGEGYVPEAVEVTRCLREGLTESPLVPLEGTLAVLRTLDRVREATGVRYEGE